MEGIPQSEGSVLGLLFFIVVIGLFVVIKFRKEINGWYQAWRDSKKD